MKHLILLIAALPAFAQKYTSYNNQPVARTSFLRSQWPAANILRDSSLIAYWPLDEKTDVAYDYSGHGLSGTFKGNNPIFIAGKLGPWTTYDNKSNGNYVNIPSITITSPFTVSAWVKPSALVGGYNRIVETNFATGLYLGTDSTMTQWQLIVNDSSIAHACKGGTVTQGLTTWTMVTAVWDGTYGYLYVNGSLIIGGSAAGTSSTGGCNFTPPTTGLTNVSMRIGCFNSGSSCSSTNSAWDGAITGFRIYGRVLSASEISAIYTAENH
jgi:hypothetical protein